jgi:hypothetical protein
MAFWGHFMHMVVTLLEKCERRGVELAGKSIHSDTTNKEIHI